MQENKLECNSSYFKLKIFKNLINCKNKIIKTNISIGNIIIIIFIIIFRFIYYYNMVFKI